MLRVNRNKVQVKKKDIILPLTIFILVIVGDTLIILNYSKIIMTHPNIKIMDAINLLTQNSKNGKEFVNIKFSKSLFDVYLATQKKLLMFYTALLMLVLGNMFKMKSDFKGIEHGSARWANEKEIKRLHQPKDSFVLADNLYLDPKDEKNKNSNELLVGGSGQGKSYKKVKPDVLQMVGSYIITDPKGELYRDLAKVLKKNGYAVKVLNILDPKYSNGYNPFKYINKDKIESDVLVLVNVFMKNTTDSKKSGGDQFWDDAMKALLTAIFLYLTLEENEEKNFERVFQLVRKVVVDEETGEIDPKRSELERIFKHIEQTNPYHPGLQAYEEFKLGAGKTAKSILISLSVRMNIWISQDICNMTYEDELEIESLGTKKIAIFLITPDINDTFNVLASMFYTQCFMISFYEADYHHNGRLPLMLSFEADEFANIGEIPNFKTIITTCRSRNIRIMPVIQSFSQLENMYKDSWKTILGGCNVINYIGSIEDDTHKYISNKLGKATVYLETQGDSRSSKSSSSSKNGTWIARDLMSQQEVSTMSDENCILFIGGMYPIIAKKFQTENHPMIKDVGSSFPDGIKNNTYIEKEYREIAKARQARAMERRLVKEEILKQNNILKKQFANLKDDELAKDFDEKFSN
ncbi:VirD4-like conjugal transfer protein, CD1115 family [Clostridium akagii]|uniref:VirD4-like conjugal transfer protein, CD1115 family n=1 Tax=Clostridium akagii TaxID=91623 RepID=UPI00047C880E|nr:type IV secretory system conjugative DNA transfer family protein [Clostridium akagii]